MRILVTGSRDWTDRDAVFVAILRQIIGMDRRHITIVHGACPTGADAFAAELADWNGIREERHPADWKARGKAAGPIRNQAMVDAGADICLAFPLDSSRGTRDCMRRAEAAGIPVVDCGWRA